MQRGLFLFVLFLFQSMLSKNLRVKTKKKVGNDEVRRDVTVNWCSCGLKIFRIEGYEAHIIGIGKRPTNSELISEYDQRKKQSTMYINKSNSWDQADYSNP